jgi:lipid-binding SYLF domain-containing protein
LLFGGGKFGRGVLYTAQDKAEGWAAVSTPSIGLQAGVQGFKMLIVFENQAAQTAFRKNQLTGSVSAVAIANESGGSGAAPFNNGVAVYQGANTGLMAGANIGLEYLRFEEMDD